MADSRILRFTLRERLLHWGHALPFIGLLITGLAMHWTGLGELFLGSPELVKRVHKFLGLSLILFPLIALVSGGKELLIYNLREVLHWQKSDLAWLWITMRRLLRKDEELPPQGRFNPGQKINTLVTLLFTWGFIFTGLLIWLTEGRGWVLPLFIHNLLFVAVIPILSGHIYLALINPSTRESIRGMIWGRVDRQWLKEHHLLWYQELTDERRADLIVYKKGTIEERKLINFIQAEGLYPGMDRKDIKSLLRRSSFIVALSYNGDIIGFGRAISDGLTYAIILDSYVKEIDGIPELRERLLTHLIDQLRPLKVPIYQLNTDHLANGQTGLSHGSFLGDKANNPMSDHTV